jgi:hypothetical protein
LPEDLLTSVTLSLVAALIAVGLFELGRWLARRW